MPRNEAPSLVCPKDNPCFTLRLSKDEYKMSKILDSDYFEILNPNKMIIEHIDELKPVSSKLFKSETKPTS